MTDTRPTSLWTDNAVLEKDATIQLRSAAYLIAVLLGGMVFVGVELIAFFSVSPPQWGVERGAAAGGPMLIALTGVLLFLETLVFPTLASTAIASEKERGTLPLLTVSALSPARIVAGKAAALAVTFAPVMLLLVPLAALAFVYGGVSALSCAAAVAALVFHGGALVCVGIGASSLTSRARSAGPLALLSAIVVGGVGAGALIAALACTVDHEELPLPLLITAFLIDGIGAAAALLLAKSALSSSRAPRWPARRVVLFAVLVVLPVVAATSLALLLPDNTNRDETTVAVVVEVVLLMLIAVGAEPALHARADHDRSPLRQALLASVLFAVGLGAARLIGDAVDFPYDNPFDTHLSTTLVLMLFAAQTSLLSAVVARLFPHVGLRLVTAFGLAASVFFLPLLLLVVWKELSFGTAPFAWLNPIAVIAAIESPGDSTLPDPVWGFGWLVASSLVLALLARVGGASRSNAAAA